MANMQSPEKMRLGLLIDRRVAARLDKAAKAESLSRTKEEQEKSSFAGLTPNTTAFL